MKNLEKRKAGFALVYALGLVVLVAGLIVAFLMSARTERSVAGGFAASNAARQLANTAVGLVQAQINEATTLGAAHAWISQPGMIRVFNANGPEKSYKLYSSDQLILDGKPTFRGDGTSEDLPSDNTWKTSPATWVDLNAPVRMDDPDKPGNASTPPGEPIYPIVDPAALKPIGSIGGLEDNGFKIDQAKAPGPTATQPVPMPVRWLYVLRNGEIVLPTGSGKNADVPGATDVDGEENDNPIVGRIAFWTDDDTCKVNVNTAGSGIVNNSGSTAKADKDVFWDIPRVSTTAEVEFAKIASGTAYTAGLPKKKEYQRFPGHPGTVALSAVLPGLKGQDYIDIAPRYETFESEPSGERLYSSLDELIFKAGLSGDSRAPTVLSEEILKSRRFFLTAHSQAPETTLFNTPRVSMWPIYASPAPDQLDPKKTTAFDRLIAFCASLNTAAGLQPYYFQRRQNRDDPTADYQNIQRNQDLYNYLRRLTSLPVPGYGTKSFLDKYPGNPSDRDQILTEIFDYIRCTNLFDPNLADPTQAFTQPFVKTTGADTGGFGYATPIRIQTSDGTTQGFGRFLSLSEFSLLFICCADGNDSTLGSNNPATNKVLDAALKAAYPDEADRPPKLAPNQRLIQAAILLELSGVSQGMRAIRPLETIRITGLGGLGVQIAGTPLPHYPFPAQPADFVFGDRGNWYTAWDRSIMGENPGFRTLFFQKQAPADSAPAGETYPFISAPFIINVPPPPATMELLNASPLVSIYSGGQATVNNRVQEITIHVPSVIVPIPDLVTSGLDAAAGEPNSDARDWWSLSRNGIDKLYIKDAHPWGRLAYATFTPGTSLTKWLNGCLIRKDFDTLVSLLPNHGDYRLIAGRNKIFKTSAGKDIFGIHPSAGPMQRMASNLSNFNKLASAGYVFGGSYVENLSFVNNSSAPDIPPINLIDPAERPYITGDFDNGVANVPDGSYINKPDEGSLGPDFDEGYFKHAGQQNAVGDRDYFTPNRVMPSPGMLGSLSTGIQADTPWQTLLFRPQPSHPQSRKYPGREDYPPDYLFLDLFWMPVVEPYAISDRLSTAGKINMNYQIMPFTYIERSTGIRAVLQPEKLTAIPDSAATTYKQFTPVSASRLDYRLSLDLKETLRQFSQKFDNGDVFISPAEICDIYMIPQGGSLSGIQGFWNTHRLTGDNSRERIYTTVYPKLTTKSNTYTVYFRAQSLKKIKGTPAASWVEDRDQVTGEYRGSTTIERFINPDPSKVADQPPDYASNLASISDATKTLDNYYKWRVVENRQFAP